MLLCHQLMWYLFFFSSRRRHTRYWRDWSSDVCSSDLRHQSAAAGFQSRRRRIRAFARVVLQLQAAALLGLIAGGEAVQQIGRASCRERVKSLDAAVWLAR